MSLTVDFASKSQAFSGIMARAEKTGDITKEELYFVKNTVHELSKVIPVLVEKSLVDRVDRICSPNEQGQNIMNVVNDVAVLFSKFRMLLIYKDLFRCDADVKRFCDAVWPVVGSLSCIEEQERVVRQFVSKVNLMHIDQYVEKLKPLCSSIKYNFPYASSFILALPIHELDEICQMAEPFVTFLSDGAIVGEILNRIQYVGKSERSQVVAICLEMFRSGNISAKQVPNTLLILLKVSSRFRSDFLHAFIFLCGASRSTNHSTEIIDVLESLFSVRKQNNIASLLRICYEKDDISRILRILISSIQFDAEYFKEVCLKIADFSETSLHFDMRESLIASFGRVLHHQREDFFKNVEKVKNGSLELNKKIVLIDMMSFFPNNKYAEIASFIEGYNMTGFAFSETFVAMNLLLRSNPSLIAVLHDNLQDKFNRITDEKLASLLAREVIAQKKDLHIASDSYLFSVCRMILSFSEERVKGKNPYHIFDKHKKQSSQLFTIEPRAYRYSSGYLSFNFQEMKKQSSLKITEQDVHRICKGAHITSETLIEMISDMKARIDGLSQAEQKIVFNYINGFHSVQLPYSRTLISSFDILCNNLKSTYLLGLLDTSPHEGEVPKISAYFKSILASIINKRSVIVPGSVLTEREEALLKASSSIQNCIAGKSESIVDYYNILGDEFKYNNLDNGVDIHHMKIKSFAYEYIHKKIVSLMMRDDVFLKELCKTKEPIPQLAHVSLYVKNMLGPHIGLSHDLEFDLHTQVLSSELLSRTVESAFSVFLRYFRLDDLIIDFQKEFEEKKGSMHLFSAAEKLMPRHLPKDKVWKCNPSIDFDITLTKEGALQLLLAVGFIKVS